MDKFPFLDIELFQHRDDRRGYIAIYSVEDTDVPTRDLEYCTAEDNCQWVYRTTFPVPHLGYSDTIEKIYRVQAIHGMLSPVQPNEYFTHLLDEKTQEALTTQLRRLSL